MSAASDPLDALRDAYSPDEMQRIESILLTTLDEDDAITVIQDLMEEGFVIVSREIIERLGEQMALRASGGPIRSDGDTASTTQRDEESRP